MRFDAGVSFLAMCSRSRLETHPLRLSAKVNLVHETKEKGDRLTSICFCNRSCSQLLRLSFERTSCLCSFKRARSACDSSTRCEARECSYWRT